MHPTHSREKVFLQLEPVERITALGTVLEKKLTTHSYTRKVRTFRSEDFLIGHVFGTSARELLVSYKKNQIHFFFPGYIKQNQRGSWIENGVVYDTPGVVRVTRGREMLSRYPEGFSAHYFAIEESFLERHLPAEIAPGANGSRWH